jgi:hypothetical protein
VTSANSSSPTNFRAVPSALRKAAYQHPNAILHEIRQLYNVSDRLNSLAEQHPLVSDALIGISGSVRNTATLLEVVVEMKMPLLSDLDPANA